MSSPVEILPEEMLAYALRVQDAVECAADDADLIERVERFVGGAETLLHFLGNGMALAFDPHRSGGETGIVHFVISLPTEKVDVWMHLERDRCWTAPRGDEPDAELWMALPTFLRIAFKTTSGADAYLAGGIEATGDVVLATSIDDWFDSPVLAVRQATR